MTGSISADAVRRIDTAWNDEILPALVDYIAVPNVSPAYAPDWAADGHMGTAVEMFRSWAAARPIPGASVEVLQLAGRTPLLLIEIPANRDELAGAPAALLYGHLDKQPEMTGWDDGKGPWTPVVSDGRLYGRGGADDGYAMFASLVAIESLVADGAAHRRIVVMIEDSYDLVVAGLPKATRLALQGAVRARSDEREQGASG